MFWKQCHASPRSLKSVSTFPQLEHSPELALSAGLSLCPLYPPFVTSQGRRMNSSLGPALTCPKPLPQAREAVSHPTWVQADSCLCYSPGKRAPQAHNKCFFFQSPLSRTYSHRHNWPWFCPKIPSSDAPDLTSSCYIISSKPSQSPPACLLPSPTS